MRSVKVNEAAQNVNDRVLRVFELTDLESIVDAVNQQVGEPEDEA